MRVYIDCLELRSLNRRKVKERKGEKDENEKRNFFVLLFFSSEKLN